MKNRNRTVYGLRSKDHGLLYEGSHYSFTEACHEAIKTNIDLSGVDMTGKDLQGLNLDGINLSNADFTDSNLAGANMSEACFTNCIFSGSSLFEACFCYSDLEKCNFIESRFGMTDFSEAKIMNCIFSGPSTFTLALGKTYRMSGNIYCHEGAELNMSRPPQILSGRKETVIILDDHIICGNDIYQNDDEAPVLTRVTSRSH